MTENEAREKWCPFARIGFSGRPGSAAVNRIMDVDSEKPALLNNVTPCIASDCMAWRDDKTANAVARSRMDNEDHGYCGLAGES